MQKDKATYWVELAEYDMETAAAMLETTRSLYVGFMCLQVIEKMLKAYWRNNLEEPALKIHILSGIYPDHAIGWISYTKADGKVENIRTDSYIDFERTVGPGSAGFTCHFIVDRGTGVNDIPVRIEVKKNEEPFVVKIELC